MIRTKKSVCWRAVTVLLCAVLLLGSPAAMAQRRAQRKKPSPPLPPAVEPQKSAPAPAAEAQKPKEPPKPEICKAGDLPGGLTIRIIVNQKYPQAPDAFIPVRPVFATLFQKLGFKITTDESTAADAILVVDFEGTPLSESYQIWQGGQGRLGRCYTGALISGTASLRRLGDRTPSRSFSGKSDPPKSTIGCAEKPSSAPFEATLLTSDLFLQIASDVARVFGDATRFCYLVAALAPAESEAEMRLADAIAASGHAQSADALMSIITSQSEGWDTRTYVTTLLAKHGPAAAQSLLQLLNSKDRVVRTLTVRTLGQLAEQSTRPAIEKTVSDPEETVRVWSHFALYRLGDDASLVRLGAYARDGSHTERMNAVQALELLRDQPAIETLIRALKPTEHGFDAERALERLTGMRLGNISERWLDWWSELRNKSRYPARSTPKTP